MSLKMVMSLHHQLVLELYCMSMKESTSTSINDTMITSLT